MLSWHYGYFASVKGYKDCGRTLDSDGDYINQSVWIKKMIKKSYTKIESQINVTSQNIWLTTLYCQ